MSTFEKCCLCIELRKGCLIIAYLQMIGQTIVAAFTVPPIIQGACLLGMNDKDAVNAGRALILIYLVTLISAVILMAFVITLLVGLYTNNRKPVKLYLMYMVVVTSLRSMVLVFQIAMGYIALEDFTFSMLSILISAYMLLVVRSYWLEMTSTKDYEITIPSWWKA